jgi:hypothetical protein
LFVDIAVSADSRRRRNPVFKAMGSDGKRGREAVEGEQTIRAKKERERERPGLRPRDDCVQHPLQPQYVPHSFCFWLSSRSFLVSFRLCHTTCSGRRRAVQQCRPSQQAQYKRPGGSRPPSIIAAHTPVKDSGRSNTAGSLVWSIENRRSFFLSATNDTQIRPSDNRNAHPGSGTSLASDVPFGQTCISTYTSPSGY